MTCDAKITDPAEINPDLISRLKPQKKKKLIIIRRYGELFLTLQKLDQPDRDPKVFWIGPGQLLRGDSAMREK